MNLDMTTMIIAAVGLVTAIVAVVGAIIGTILTNLLNFFVTDRHKKKKWKRKHLEKQIQMKSERYCDFMHLFTRLLFVNIKEDEKIEELRFALNRSVIQVGLVANDEIFRAAQQLWLKVNQNFMNRKDLMDRLLHF